MAELVDGDGDCDGDGDGKVVSASLEIDAAAGDIFGLIADPSEQPRWDGNDNLAVAAPGQRVHSVGDVFETTLTRDAAVRENHVVEFEEGRLIAWMPGNVGEPVAGHLWRWQLEALTPTHTLVTHTYDWTRLIDQNRVARAQATTTDNLRASLDRLAEAARATGEL